MSEGWRLSSRKIKNAASGAGGRHTSQNNTQPRDELSADGFNPGLAAHTPCGLGLAAPSLQGLVCSPVKQQHLRLFHRWCWDQRLLAPPPVFARAVCWPVENAPSTGFARRKLRSAACAPHEGAGAPVLRSGHRLFNRALPGPNQALETLQSIQWGLPVDSSPQAMSLIHSLRTQGHIPHKLRPPHTYS